jgi:GlpG protein
MIKVFSAPLAEDLTKLTQFLWLHEVPHRVLEKGDCQELWVDPAVNSDDILMVYEMSKRGEDLSHLRMSAHPENAAVSAQAPEKSNFLTLAKRAWFSSALIILSILLSLLIGFGGNFDWLRLFTITDFYVAEEGVYPAGLHATFESMQYWRFITPIFLHFSELHIVFNVLWIWVVGTRVECLQNRTTLIALVIFSGISANLAQYWMSGPLFGGLSGVVFALLAYVWLWDRLYVPKFGLPSALIGFMVFWLALGYSGVLASIGFGAIANTAHLVGLLAGLAFVPIGKLLAKA